MPVKRNVFREADDIVKGATPIPAPHLESLGAGVGYMATFANALVRVTIDGIRQGRDGLKGDVRVEAGPYGDRYRLLTEGRLELASMTQRESWERRLKRREPGTAWEEIMDLFCAAVLAAEKRLDRPATLLRSTPKPQATGMLLEPLLLAGLPTIWYGDGGTAKSLLALASGISLHTGVALVGRTTPACRLRVLYADFEFDAWEHRERMRKLLHMQQDDPDESMPDIAYLDCSGGTIVNQAERIMSAIREYEAQYLIVDSISYAADGPLNEDETARQYYRVLGYIGLPSLSTGHTPKNGSADSPFGSVHWKNLSRLAWHFQVCDTEQPGELSVKLTNKRWSTGQVVPPVGLTIRFGYDGIDVVRANPATMTGQLEEHWRRVQSLLRRENRPMTYEEIAVGLGLEAAQVKARVAEHKEAFVILPPLEGSRRARVALRAEEP